MPKYIYNINQLTKNIWNPFPLDFTLLTNFKTESPNLN